MPGITAQAAVLLPFGHKIARMPKRRLLQERRDRGSAERQPG